MKRATPREQFPDKSRMMGGGGWRGPRMGRGGMGGAGGRGTECVVMCQSCDCFSSWLDAVWKLRPIT